MHWLLVTTQENERKVRKSLRKRRKTCVTIIVGNRTRNLSIGNRCTYHCTIWDTHTYTHTHTHTRAVTLMYEHTICTQYNDMQVLIRAIATWTDRVKYDINNYHAHYVPEPGYTRLTCNRGKNPGEKMSKSVTHTKRRPMATISPGSVSCQISLGTRSSGMRLSTISDGSSMHWSLSSTGIHS